MLKSAAAIEAGENRTNLPLDGEVLIFLADVAHMQRV